MKVENPVLQDWQRQFSNMQKLAFILITPPSCNANCEELRVLFHNLERDFIYETVRFQEWSSQEIKAQVLGINQLPAIVVVDEQLSLLHTLEPAIAGQNADIEWAYSLLNQYGYQPNSQNAGIQEKLTVWSKRNPWFWVVLALLIVALGTGLWFWKFK